MFVCVKKVMRLVLFCGVIFAVSCVSEGDLTENDRDLNEKNEEDVSEEKDEKEVSDKDNGNSGNTGDSGNTGNTGNTGDTGDTGNTGNIGDTGDSGDTGNTGNDEDDEPDEDVPVVEEPKCFSDADCSGGQACFFEKCRDKCNALLNPCNWKPSGDKCVSGHCVECQKDSDCPGTRYTCNTMNYTCVDKPFNPNITKIGMFYHTWHCPASKKNPVLDLTLIHAGHQNYGDYQKFHYWGEPEDGYYCLSENDALLEKHAVQLRDMGIDFVFVDVTNHAYAVNTHSDRAVQMIIEPFDRMLAVWSKVPDAPRIVPWVPVPGNSENASFYMVDALQHRLNNYPGLQFQYLGKPLIMVTDNPWSPVNETRIAQLSQNYTIRRMWGLYPDGGSNWSFMQSCRESPLHNRPCEQRIVSSGGSVEQIPISIAYQATYMTNTATATPKHQGKTFRKQFETLINNPEAAIVTITGWNEWISQRQQCDTVDMCPCSDFPQGCFLDAWNIEYNRDIEPGKNAMGDYYYRLAKACIKLFRDGKRCDYQNKDNLCCKDYQ